MNTIEYRKLIVASAINNLQLRRNVPNLSKLSTLSFICIDNNIAVYGI